MAVRSNRSSGRAASNDMTDRSVRKRTRRTGGGDAVFEALRERISSHKLPPGSKLRENDLAREFGVSRTRVREVFGALEQRGLIERVPNRGAVVSRLELKEAADIYDVREYLEALCVRRATLKAPDGAWDDLLAKIEPLIEHEFDDNEFDIYLTYLDDLRARMLRYADNAFLARMLSLIDDKSHVIARRVIILPGRSAMALRLHKDLIEAMKRRDADEAERLRREILSSARMMLEKYKRFVL